MKKIVLFAAFYLLSSSVSYSQDTWVRFFGEEYQYTFDHVFKSLAFDDSYIYFISSSSFPLNDPNYTDFSLKTIFYKVDMDGNLITKKYLAEGFNPYWYSATNLKILSDGNLLFFGNYITKDGKYPHFVMKLSPEGEQLWVNHLPTYTGNGTISDMEELEDGSIVLLGFGWNDILEHKAQIYKLSANGDILWNKLVPNPSGFFSRSWEHSMVILPTTGDILFTSQLFITGSNSHAYATVTKLDSVGNYIWDRPIYLQPREFSGTVMELLPDGNLVFAATIDTSGLGIWPVYRKIAKLDTAAHIIWEFKGPVKGADEFWDVVVTHTGDILLCGQNFYGEPFDPNDTTKMPAGNILKLSSSGDVLWERFYTSTDNIAGWSGPITKLQLLPNGGILAICDIPRFFYAGNDDVMLMKLDSNGCLDNSCDTLNVLTEISDLPNIESSLSSVRFYPNPSSGLFYIDFPEGIEKPDIRIYNILGQLVKQYRQLTKNQPIELSKKGMYLISIREKGKLIGSRTIVVE